MTEIGTFERLRSETTGLKFAVREEPRMGAAVGAYEPCDTTGRPRGVPLRVAPPPHQEARYGEPSRLTAPNHCRWWSTPNPGEYGRLKGGIAMQDDPTFIMVHPRHDGAPALG
jgi:hypothetical protein